MTDKLADDRKEAILAQIPAGRMGGVEDIASAVAFLASNGAGYVTHQLLQQLQQEVFQLQASSILLGLLFFPSLSQQFF